MFQLKYNVKFKKKLIRNSASRLKIKPLWKEIININTTLVYRNTQFDVYFHRDSLDKFHKYKNVISRYRKLPEYFIKEQATVFNWDSISKN